MTHSHKRLKEEMDTIQESKPNADATAEQNFEARFSQLKKIGADIYTHARITEAYRVSQTVEQHLNQAKDSYVQLQQDTTGLGEYFILEHQSIYYHDQYLRNKYKKKRYAGSDIEFHEIADFDYDELGRQLETNVKHNPDPLSLAKLGLVYCIRLYRSKSKDRIEFINNIKICFILAMIYASDDQKVLVHHLSTILEDVTNFFQSHTKLGSTTAYSRNFFDVSTFTLLIKPYHVTTFYGPLLQAIEHKRLITPAFSAYLNKFLHIDLQPQFMEKLDALTIAKLEQIRNLGIAQPSVTVTATNESKDNEPAKTDTSSSDSEAETNVKLEESSSESNKSRTTSNDGVFNTNNQNLLFTQARNSTSNSAEPSELTDEEQELMLLKNIAAKMKLMADNMQDIAMSMQMLSLIKEKKLEAKKQENTQGRKPT